jgi:hypothetical protein
MALRDEHLFSITSLPDQIALLAVFMPTIRSCADAYVKTWNRHKIRKQPKRPWVVDGKPIFNYQHSARLDLKQAADPTLLQVLQEDNRCRLLERTETSEYQPSLTGERKGKGINKYGWECDLLWNTSNTFLE